MDGLVNVSIMVLRGFKMNVFPQLEGPVIIRLRFLPLPFLRSSRTLSAIQIYSHHYFLVFLEPCSTKFFPCTMDHMGFVEKIANVQCDFLTFVGQLVQLRPLPKFLLSTLDKPFMGYLQQSFSRTSGHFQLVWLPKLIG